MKKIFVALLCAAIIFSCGCGDISQYSSTEVSQPDAYSGDLQTIHGVHLRDKKLLYENRDPAEVVTMYLTVSSGNAGENTNHTWEEINTYSVFDYERMGVDRYKVAGLLQVGDENGLIPGELGYNQVSPNCTVQIRGQSSSLNSQKNYKISIKNNKGDWQGQTTIALNKHQGDGLRFRNKLAYDLIAGIDEMMGLRTTFVHLYVKDTTAGGNGIFEDYGMYTQVEQLNRTALKAHGLDRNGHLYKINFCEFYRYEDVIKLKDDPSYNQKAFEEILEIKGNDDHQKLITMLEKINDFSIPIDSILEQHFDTENIAYWMAFQILIGNIDTQSRNFYIYSPLNSERWYILDWDNDGAFKRTEYSLLGRVDQSEWESGVSNYWGNVLFQRCLKSENFRTILDAAIEDLKAYLTPERINEKVNIYSSVLKPRVYSMPDSMYAPLTASQYDTVAASIASEVDTNYALYKESFTKPMPFFIGLPVKTGEKLSFVWDTAYDFNSESITYTFELATDCNFSAPIHKEENLILPATELPMLPKGQYFIRVYATNASGKRQSAFDYYITDIGKVYGTKCFYIDADGKVLEDVYVED
ncbi:MAG: CotH kinase family protein [Clostridia bacterium]|nr:CotH kinase family protein [Clostridia bacterium]